MMMSVNKDYCLKNKKVLFTTASWEERFTLGMKSLIDEGCIEKMIVFYYEEYNCWTQDCRRLIQDKAFSSRIEYSEYKLSFNDTVESWKTVMKVIRSFAQNENILLDISTMPREVVWYICDEFVRNRKKITYVYNPPEKYAEWLSRDPGRPRFLYRLGGVHEIGKKTLLFIQTGFDVERTKHLVRVYEPDMLILALQIGRQYENSEKNVKAHKMAFKDLSGTEYIEIDGYDYEESLVVVKHRLMGLASTYNIIVASLGPKVCSMAIYKFREVMPDIALIYVPSNEYNDKYSYGIKESIYGELD
jgi:hypothetical protein